MDSLTLTPNLIQRLPGGSVVAAEELLAIVVVDAGQHLSLQTEGHSFTSWGQSWGFLSRQGEALFSYDSRINYSL